MPTFTTSDGQSIHYQVAGPADAPSLILSNSLGTNLHMWDAQADAFSRTCRLIRYDSRGHGQSAAPDGPYTIARLGQDAVELADHLGIERFYWCGLSKGGMIGMWLGTNHGNRLIKLVLANTAPHVPPPTMWQERSRAARQDGMDSLKGAVIERWFTPEFRASDPDAVDRIAGMLSSTSGEGYAACCEAIAAMDQRGTISVITTPTLIIGGTRDPATPSENAEFMADKMPGAELVLLDAAHLSNIEQADQFTSAVLDFLGR